MKYCRIVRSGELLMDPYYTVDKKTFKLAGFTPLMDREGYTKAIKNPIYLRTKE